MYVVQQAKWKPFRLALLIGMALAIVQCTVLPTREPASKEAAPQPEALDEAPDTVANPSFFQQNWPDDAIPVAKINGITIPPGYPIEVAVSEGLQTVEEFAAVHNALAVLNGGFFDPSNAQTTSFVTSNGLLVADPRENQRLVDNPDLATYMEQILNRSEFRRYQCVDGIRYDITVHNAALPPDCRLHSALGAGPQLLPNDTSQAEGFTDYANGELMRDALGSQRRNARSAVGVKQDGTVVWVMVAQVNESGGMTLAELADYMTRLAMQKVLNLDGGSSASLYLAPQLRKERTTQPNSSLRPVKSVFLLPSF